VVSHAVNCHILTNALVSYHFGCVYKGIEVRTVCPHTGYVFSMSHIQRTGNKKMDIIISCVSFLESSAYEATFCGHTKHAVRVLNFVVLDG